jgi:hypothetical protein
MAEPRTGARNSLREIAYEAQLSGGLQGERDLTHTFIYGWGLL